jgi:DHA1 family bicyclomycin/chloramphenicol resistance-like MFS transporter
MHSMDSNPTPHAGMGFKQFVALIAAIMATNALAIDAMLPALGRIGQSLGLSAANERQWIITAYLLGFGAAQIVYGTLADRYGRRPILFLTLGIYILASLACAASRSLDAILISRFIEGLGAAGTRVIAISVVRDCYAGRLMARVMSLSLLVFLGVPVLAPSLGQLIMLVAPWPVIFLVLAVYGAAVAVWAMRKLPETLHPADRRAIDIKSILAAGRITLSNRPSVGYTLALTLMIGAWFGFINAAQQIFADVFHAQRIFTLVFALIAGGIAAAAIANARLVSRIGSRKISHAALLGFAVLAIAHVALAASSRETVVSFTPLQMAMMFCFGLMIGNFGAMAMESLGHLAGSAASLQGLVSTLGAALIGFFIGQSFNGTMLPITLGFLVCSFLALAAVIWAERGKFFVSRQLQTA